MKLGFAGARNDYSESICKMEPFLADDFAPMHNKLILGIAAAFACFRALVSSGADTAAPKPVSDLIARVHFVGMNQVVANPNAKSFNAIWQLPATQEVLEEAIAKLATAPYRLYQTHFTDKKDHAELLRPLFRDLINS